MGRNIKIKDAHKYLGKTFTPNSIKVFGFKIKRLINAGVLNGNDEEVDLDSLKEYEVFESNVLENYMPIKEFGKLLNLTKWTPLKEFIRKLENPFSFDYIDLAYTINRQSFYVSKTSVDKFFRNYIDVKVVISKYSWTNKDWYYRCNKYGITPLVLGLKSRYVTKSDLKTIEEYENYDRSDYYTTKECKKILSVECKVAWTQFKKDYNLESQVVEGGFQAFKKDVIDNLKTQQTELIEKYITYEEAVKIASAHGFSFHPKNVKSEMVTSLFRPFFKSNRRIFLKEDFSFWLGEREKSIQYGTVELDSPFDTFKYRLGLKSIDTSKLGAFTSETWLQFVSNTLNSSKGNPITINNEINKFVNCTIHLVGMVCSVENREIYSLTSNDFNTLFNKIPVRQSRRIYLYLKAINHKLLEKNLKSFNMKRILNPYQFKVEPQDKSIYRFEEYKKVYNYTKDISLHKEMAIKDTLEEISTGKSQYYASSWLYVLLHMNNAWRHSDVITFPRVNLSGTRISDLNWLLDNELSEDEANYIVTQVHRKELIISKTQVNNYFFCSEELKKPIATSIAICELRTNILSPQRESLIDFGNKNKVFTLKQKESFFGPYDKEFEFSSRKMNRSLLTYIYVLLSKLKKGEVALKTAQKLRGHIDQETTNLYVEIPEEELNFLSKQLFARGSFGFIHDTFLDLLQGNEVDREKRTIEIHNLENHFGGIHKIEEISRFLNVIQNERKTILDQILSMSLEEALSFVNKIDTNQLPSKEDNVQCMVSEKGCVKKGQGISCFDCAYSIPSYYALSAFGASLQRRLNSFLESNLKELELPYYENRKRARLLYLHLELFAQAIEKFGLDVYEFISDTRDEFIWKNSKIGSLNDQYQLT
ncbi:hypothetical protein [Peribacillus sp. AS_2]|uniref:hypothetical protein n=1 Tax=Peribacillus sp. AS_2 TaxID=2996755 RepID=UPI0022A7CBB6|nr:hypothetical protein [Peribacillus sp. AS_2]MCZ0871247.1 hypothetical protein [Peribacillus sp. AS_2]